MSRIKILPPLVVNKIAAGEVVERPASVVKELMENAVDSGATRVDVSLEKGGADSVRVVDNGRGISAEELPLAITNHATSKIATAEELFEVDSLGFRGEALASIASVSRLTIRSRTEEAEGAELEVSGGAEGTVAPSGCPRGTSVECRDLFYNTPVRQKFLRTPQTEAGHSTEAFTRVALANPKVHFTLSHNGRLVHDLPTAASADDEQGMLQRIGALFGDALASALIPVSSRDVTEQGEEVLLSGHVAAPTESRSHTKMQYLLLNGRTIRDRSLQHALSEAYRGLLLTGRKPICFLRLSMPPRLVDVNVHPMKLEVRFAQAGSLYSQLLGALRSKFLSTDLRAGTTAPSESPESPNMPGPSELVSWAKETLSQRRLDEARGDHSSSSAAPFKPYPNASPYSGANEPLTLRPFHREAPSQETLALSDERETTDVAVTHRVDPPTTGHAPSGRFEKALQLHNRYLVVENDEGMEIIDQHALHERVLYEQLRKRVLEGPLETQRLLVPEPVDLSPSEAAAVMQQIEMLKKIGLGVESFGGDTVLVTTLPALLGKASPESVLREVASKMVEEGQSPEARDLCDELLHSMSCKAAVKFGDPLTEEEIQALLASRHETENHHHCPHGRPTSLVFTREELDRKFQRV